MKWHQPSSGSTVTANSIVGGTDQVFSRTDSAGARSYLTDGLGSTLALADTSGAVQTSYAYTPYGATTTTGVASTNAVQYTGRENDANGLYYYRARYYNPTTGRFISEDPLGLAAGINLYAYAADDPVDLNDPSGMFAPILVACAAGAAFNVAVDLFTNWLSGRKSTLGGLLVSAAVGCVGGVIGLGAGKLFGWALGKIGPEIGVLGRYPGYLQLGEILGSKAKVFSIPQAVWNTMSAAGRWAANQAFLDELIASKTAVELSTNVMGKVGGTFEQELKYLISHGYTISEDGWWLVPPK